MRGPLWKICSYFCFSAINGFVRYLAVEASNSNISPLPAYEVAFFQNLFGLIFLLPWMLWNSCSLKTHRPMLQLCHVLLSACGVVLWYMGLAYEPLAQAVALMFLGPLITVLGAYFFLKESISRNRALSLAIGFLGGLVLTQGNFSWSLAGAVALLPVCAACCFAAATLLVRRLVAHDPPQLVALYLLLFMAPLLLLPTTVWGRVPMPWEWPSLAAMGLFAALAHLSLNKAYSEAEVTYLLPYGLTKWLSSALIGVLAFAEVPSLLTCGGALILIVAVATLGYTEQRAHKGLKNLSLCEQIGDIDNAIKKPLSR